MADETDAAAKKAAEDAKKAKEDSVKAQENPPQPYPTQEQLDRIKNGEPAEEVLGDGPPDADSKPAADKAAADKAAAKGVAAGRTMEPDKPAGYQTR